MNKTEKDEIKATVLAALWMCAFSLGCALGNTLGLVIIAFSSALAGMYLKYDDERERKEEKRELINQKFKEALEDERL